MARQGNYVPNAGSNVNFASGLSSSLTDLSRSLLNQAQEKERLALQQEKLEEDKRQFGTTEERQKASLLADLIYKQQESKNTADYRQKQLDLEKDRLKIAQDKAAADEAERKRLLSIRNKTEEYSDSFGYSDLEEYSPELAKKISSAGGFEAIDNVVSKAEALFDTSSDKFMPNRVNEYISAVEQQRGEELTPQQREEMATALEAQMRPLYAIREQDRGRFKEDVLNLLGIPALQESKQAFIERAPTALTKEEAVRFHTGRLIKAGVPRAEALKEAESIATINARKSYGDILAERTAAAETANKSEEQRIEATKDYIDLQVDILDKLGSGKSGYKSSGDPAKDITTLLKEGGVHSNVDEDELNQLVNRYSTLVPKYGSDVAMAATLRSFKPGVMFPGFGDEILPLADAEQFALDIKNMKGSSSNANSSVLKTARENLKANLSRDLLTPKALKGPNMDAWRAGRWGDRARAALYGLSR
jgi:hypothetical protein